MLYPISVRNHDEFLTASECLTLNKDDEGGNEDKTNLEYLLLKMNGKSNNAEDDDDVRGEFEKKAAKKKAEEERARFSQYFIRICELVFHIKYGVRCGRCGKIYDYHDFLVKASDKTHVFHCECWDGSSDQEDFD